jgi:hypothetical protein
LNSIKGFVPIRTKNTKFGPEGREPVRTESGENALLNTVFVPSSYRDEDISSQQSSMPFIELLPQDVDRYKALKNGQKELTAALKLSKQRGSGGDEL